VPDEIVDATITWLPRIVADMVRLKRLCGCRPGEIVQIRPGDVDRSKAFWSYIPAEYKTQHHGLDRQIFIGPRGQAILLPYLLLDAQAFCFVPAESEAERNALRREQRQSPMTPSHRNRKPKRNPKKTAGDSYDRDSYRQAITRACNTIDRELKRQANREAEEVNKPLPWKFAKGEACLFPTWAPNQLRHAAATALREHYGSRQPNSCWGIVTRK
jgi:integrase